MVHARALGLPVPEVFASRFVAGHPVMVIEWIAGGTMLMALRRRPWRAAELGRRSGDLMIRLHNALAPAGLAPARSWPVPSAFPAPLRERLAAPDVRADCLVHLDFHPANLVVSGDEVDVLIDWTNARAGDPRFDVARTTLIAAMLPGLSGVERVLARQAIEPYVRAWRASYLAATGPLPGMPVFLAWAGYGMLAEWGPKPGDSRAVTGDVEGWKRQLEGLVQTWMTASGLSTELLA
jgi:aminoglycoside phosphotransferase (APT) family kinase protein